MVRNRSLEDTRKAFHTFLVDVLEEYDSNGGCTHDEYVFCNCRLVKIVRSLNIYGLDLQERLVTLSQECGDIQNMLWTFTEHMIQEPNDYQGE